jgi:hypothetical protein
LLDIGCDVLALIDSSFVIENQILAEKLQYPIGVELADGHLPGTT